MTTKRLSADDYLQYPTLDELRARGHNSRTLQGYTYRSQTGNPPRLMTKTVKIVNGEKIAVTKIETVELF